jgi:hypothetical protein
MNPGDGAPPLFDLTNLCQLEVSKSTAASPDVHRVSTFEHDASRGFWLHLQSWECTLFGHPRRMRRFAVCTLVWRSNQAKILSWAAEGLHYRTTPHRSLSSHAPRRRLELHSREVSRKTTQTCWNKKSTNQFLRQQNHHSSPSLLPR